MVNEKYRKLLDDIKQRYNMHKRHFNDLTWEMIENKLYQNTEKMDSLLWMEETGGEPSVLEFDNKTNTLVFCDFSIESPIKRRSLCYDQQALESRSKNKPNGSVMKTCMDNKVVLLNQEQYEKLQTFSEFDNKTSSWIQTPESIRSLGGALFMDRRYNAVFVYHNGAESYYSSRGFRVSLKV